MSFCNNSKLPAITPTVKRGAPAIPLEEFNNILTDYYNMGIGSGDLLDYYKEASEKETFIKNIFKFPQPYTDTLQSSASAVQ